MSPHCDVDCAGCVLVLNSYCGPAQSHSPSLPSRFQRPSADLASQCGRSKYLRFVAKNRPEATPATKRPIFRQRDCLVICLQCKVFQFLNIRKSLIIPIICAARIPQGFASERSIGRILQHSQIQARKPAVQKETIERRFPLTQVYKASSKGSAHHTVRVHSIKCLRNLTDVSDI